jgi:hypothetical protein
VPRRRTLSLAAAAVALVGGAGGIAATVRAEASQARRSAGALP